MFDSLRCEIRNLRRRSRRGSRLQLPARAGPIGLALLGVVQAAWGVRQAIAVRRLRTARSRASDEAAAKSTLLRLASHEIRTPLALARGYVDIVRSEALGPVGGEVDKALISADQQLRHIEELIMEMVEAARVEDRDRRLRLVRLDAREVVEEAAARATEQLGPDHRLHVSVTERPAMVMAERFRLRTVLVNLLSNAIKYSPDGGEVRCTLRECRQGIQVAVADRGIGLRPADMRELFQPFTRLPAGVKAAPTGLGMGLHLARTIAEAHRGTLTAALNPGGGSVFTLWLPGTD